MAFVPVKLGVTETKGVSPTTSETSEATPTEEAPDPGPRYGGNCEAGVRR